MTEVRAPGHEFNYSEFEEIHDALDEVINIPYHSADTLAEMEETIIRVAVQVYGGNVTHIAKSLGIGRATLYRKFAQFGVITTGTR